MDAETRPRDERPERRETAAVACALCGVSADGVIAPPTWIRSVEDGARRYFCDECARTHITAIEGRLDSAWW
ncbi:hypothetical protein [Streptomyces sp. NPDC052042]|uniref:hypothetical protein n=1 Tax=Streptomyces sp. NPDC052042 TaxID=3365683 RepID=UPI0037D5D233